MSFKPHKTWVFPQQKLQGGMPSHHAWTQGSESSFWQPWSFFQFDNQSGWQIKLPCCFPAGLGELWPDFEAGGCLTLFSLQGHVIKFIINAELIWLPWLTLSDFSLACIYLHGENDCHRAERLFPSSNTFGPATVELCTLTSKSDPQALKDRYDIMSQKWCRLHFIFPSISELWQRSSLSRICKAFRWEKGKISNTHA